MKKVLDHEYCAGNSWYISISDEELKKTYGEGMVKVKTEVPLGGLLLIHQLIPHRSREQMGPTELKANTFPFVRGQSKPAKLIGPVWNKSN